ncbi:hypothetical protein GGI04_001129 [Coemansia thaxteri]|nr:hypothetical protein GGI04_001129 [Coemansia thaxteri]
MVSVKRQGCPAVFIYNRVSKRRSELQLPYNGSCAVQPEPNPNFEATTVRLGFSSPVHLKSVVEYDMSPTLVRVYGAYGVSLEPEFRLEDVPLLLRGWVIALAHVRGGSELGREWYSAGKGAKKPNSVEDFVACARFLLDKGWSGPERLAATGVSAGGLVVGAALNKCPEYFRAAALHVPFVDPLSAMLSPDLPLTSVEVSEWGDPFASAASYKAIRGYAPYDNIGEINSGGHGPSILVTAGGQDQRVSVWQPAKWVARLRRAGGYGSIAHSGGSNMSKLLFYPMMNAGHFHANTPEPSTDYDATGDTGFIGAQALRNAFLIRETSTGNR